MISFSVRLARGERDRSLLTVTLPFHDGSAYPIQLSLHHLMRSFRDNVQS